MEANLKLIFLSNVSIKYEQLRVQALLNKHHPFSGHSVDNVKFIDIV